MSNLETKNSMSNTSEKYTEIILINLPKISVNEWYSGNHWTKRQAIKTKYKWLVKSQFKGIFSKENEYEVTYSFEFKSNPLDCSNCVAMVKLVEDIIFESDSPKIVKSVTLLSVKGKSDKLTIKIKEICKHL